jgi:hypothetical protein
MAADDGVVTTKIRAKIREKDNRALREGLNIGMIPFVWHLSWIK